MFCFFSLLPSLPGEGGDAAGCADDQEDHDSRGEAHRSLQAGRGELLFGRVKLDALVLSTQTGAPKIHSPPSHIPICVSRSDETWEILAGVGGGGGAFCEK